ncbi:NUDIX domain-containing protein [Brevibacillus fluminis]|uniref:NUDIX domain-containing protein n=2 Tax=Brevibacillus fluminis TaxID=511487 RepID=A0A3M8DG16_9BACL|nr:NUDIX domain-containing protein [Brevibacillus fluminis]
MHERECLLLGRGRLYHHGNAGEEEITKWERESRMEQLTIYNENMEKIGVMEREQVHKEGWWHETFHCWFVKIVAGELYLYVQKRQAGKDTFPEKFDITAAGHLRAHESPEDGQREVAEELGIEVDFAQFVPLGIFADEGAFQELIDREFCHVYAYRSEHALSDFHLQLEEVSGMYLIKLQDMIDLFAGKIENLQANGFEATATERTDLTVTLTVTDFVPHQTHYYQGVFGKIIEVFA